MVEREQHYIDLFNPEYNIYKIANRKIRQLKNKKDNSKNIKSTF